MFGERSVKQGRALGYGPICETMRPRPKSSQEKDQVKSRIKPELLCDKGSAWSVLRTRWAESVGRGQSERSAPLREGLENRIQSKGADICHHDDVQMCMWE